MRRKDKLRYQLFKNDDHQNNLFFDFIKGGNQNINLTNLRIFLKKNGFVAKNEEL